MPVHAGERPLKGDPDDRFRRLDVPDRLRNPPAPLAKEAEDRGFESLWFPEHTHIPTSRKSPWPGGGDLPQEYWHTHDPFVALAAAAGATEKIMLGTGILLVPEHDVIVCAKSSASLDMVSDGRLILGIGAGWNAEELQNHGWAFKDRWNVTRDRCWPGVSSGPRMSRSSTASSLTSTRSGPTRSRSRRTAPRCCWARSRSGPSTEWSTTATAGCRSPGAVTCAPTWSS